FFFRVDDPCSSSLYQPGPDRYSNDGRKPWEVRRVPPQARRAARARRDSASRFHQGRCRGLREARPGGAQKLLATGSLGMEIESNFNTSSEYPTSHFAMVQDLVRPHGLLVFDLNFNRVPRATFQQALQRAGLPRVGDQQTVGRLSTMNVL